MKLSGWAVVAKRKTGRALIDISDSRPTADDLAKELNETHKTDAYSVYKIKETTDGN